MSKKQQSLIESEAMDRLIDYSKAACVICKKVYPTSLYIRLREQKDIILCKHCSMELIDALGVEK